MDLYQAIFYADEELTSNLEMQYPLGNALVST